MQTLLVSWLAFGVVLAAIPTLAEAGDKTLVLLEVEGEETPRLGKSLERLVKTQHEVLPGSVYRDAARRLRAVKLTPNNVKKVCAYLNVDGVVDGLVVQEDGSYRFLVRVRSAANGIIEKKIPMRLSQARLSEEMANKLADRLMLAIDDLPAVDKDGESGTRVADRVADDEEPGPGKKGKRVAATKANKGKGKAKGKGKGGPDDDGDEDDEDNAADEDDEISDSKLAGRKKDKPKGDKAVASAGRGDRGGAKPAALAGGSSRGAGARTGDDDSDDDADTASAGDDTDAAGGDDDEDDGEADDGEADGGDEDEDDLDGSLEDEADLATAPRTSPRTTPLLVHAGVSFVGRKLAFSSTEGAANPPPGFSGSPVPGAYIAGETYPGVFAGKRGLLANLGVGFVLDRVIKLNSSVPDATMMGTVNLSTRMWRYGVNLRYRHNFGSEPNGYSVQASLGFNSAGFSINKNDAPGGADSVDVPNVNYKYIDAGLAGRIPIIGALSFLAEAKFLSPLTTGPIQSTTQYGAASVLGVDGEAVFEYQITPNIQARAGGRIMYLKYSFDGTGALDDRDGNGQADVTGASDRFLGGFVTAGYSF